MEILAVLVLSIIAGWLVNGAADALPERVPIADAMRMPWSAFRCALGYGGEETCERRHTVRTMASFIVTVGLGLLAYMRFGFEMEAAVVALYAWYLLAVTIIDYEHRKVLNRMLIAALPVVAIVIAFTDMVTLRSALMGAAIGFGVFLLTAVLRRGGMGMGDVKLAGLIGLATGVAGVAISMVVGIVTAGIAGLIIMMSRRMDRRATMAYAPYLALGAWTAMYYGADILQVYFA